MKKLLLSVTAALFALTASFAQAPTNDECFFAIPITVQTGNCTSVAYTNVNSTTDADDPNPGLCWLQTGATTVADPPSHTVWFSFVPASSSVEISTNFQGYSLANTQIVVLSGPCFNLVQVSCAEDINTNQGLLHTQIAVHGLTPGNNYYIMVDGNINQTGTFGICVQNIPPPGPPLPQQDCITGSYLCDYTTFSVPNGAGSTGSVQENPSCFGSPGERSSWWYIFTPIQSGPFCYAVTPNSVIDIDVALFDVTSGCPGVEIHCNWNGSTANGGVTGLGTAPFCSNPDACDPCINVIAGHTYALLVDRFTSTSTSGYTVEFASTNPPLASPSASFAANIVCVGAPTVFTNQSPGGMNASWNFGDPNATNNNTSTLLNPTHTYTQPGTYTATLTVTANPGGCQNAFSRQITVLPTPTMQVSPTSPTICQGQSVPISASITPTPPSIPATFTNTSSMAIPANSTTTASSPVQVTGVAPATVSANPIVSVCLNIQHTRVSDLEVQLMCPNGTVMNLAMQQGGPTGANYSNVCFVPTGAASITSQNAPFIGDFTPQQPFSNLNACNVNGTWTLVVRDVVTGETGTLNNWSITFLSEPRFQWSPATGLSSTLNNIVVASPTTTTTYTATLLSVPSCSANGTITVNVTPSPAAPVVTSNSPLCLGSQLQLSATGSAGTTFSWVGPNGFTSALQNPAVPVFTSNDVGLYSVYSIAAGCTSATPGVITVAIDNSLAVSTSASLATICPGQTTTLSASGATTYSWLPSPFLTTTTGATVTATPTQTTTFTVVGTSGTCSNVSTVTVTVSSAAPTPAPTFSGPVCVGDNFNIGITGASPGTTYSWTGPGGFTSTTATNNFTNATPAMAGLYSVTASTGVGCVSAVATVNVVVNPLPAFTLTPAPTICAGQDIVLNATGTGTFSWSPATGLSPVTGSDVIASPAQTTTYTVVSTLANCTSTDTVTVTVNAAPAAIAIANPGPVCEGADITLAVTGAVAGTNFTWTGPNGFTSSQASNNLSNVTAANSGVYSITASIANCTTDTTINVVVNPTPAFTYSSSTTICEGQAISLTADGTDTFTWSPATGLTTTTGPEVIASPTTTTTYTITGTSAAGCSKTEQIVLQVAPAINLAASNSIEICPGTSTQLTATTSNGTNFTWFPAAGLNDATIANPIATPSATTTYMVSVAAGGCTDSATVVVTVSSPVNVNVTADFLTGPAPHAVQFTNNTTGATGFSWNFGDNTPASTEVSPQHNYVNPGTYYAILTSAYGVNCTQVDTVATVVVEPSSQPNVFTPNGDGINDEFKILVTKKPFDLRVFNRWGGVVEQRDNYHLNQNWKAEGLPSGLYFYQIKTNDGEIYKGWIEILR